ncbi:hypothetical protein [Nocardioides caldifontis]|uniref:hypothetical protein n=1 Tax=Nocardioides caldifontis TaxID=2588938 RepID=UPI0011E02EFB|nr:hypothetical protein [Nocardioides caldifontis]
MARPADLVVDETPLDGPRIDVASRIGWLLRISRQVAGVSLADVADRLAEAAGVRTSVAALSRLERSGGRNGQVVDAYEAALDLEPSRLRAPIELMCRAFSPYAPVDRAPLPAGRASLSRFDALVAAAEGPAPTGGEWLSLAREHDESRPFGVTGPRMAALVEKLADETGRSVGIAFIARRETLRRLRCSPYGDLIEDLARQRLAEPDTQAHVDLLSVLAERPTPSVMALAASALGSDSFLAARGAGLAFERMRDVATLGPAEWSAVVQAVASAARRAVGDPHREAVLGSVLHTMPAPFRQEVVATLDVPLAPPRVPAGWTTTRRNQHYGYAEELGRTVAREVGVPEQPMLTRLLFEVLYDFRLPRAMSAGAVLLASPFHRALPRALEQAVLDAPDGTTRAGALSTPLQVPMDWGDLDLPRWFAIGATEVDAGALVVAGQGGVAVPEERLAAALEHPMLRDRATYAAGMAQHPVLARWAADETLPNRVRTAARWWLDRGGRITR